MSTALVVGGTSGIGLATARHLRSEGATVHVAGRSAERLNDLAATTPRRGTGPRRRRNAMRREWAEWAADQIK
jgi:NADP-dependent 3-hydroxy acid dehydrogenase YdfG